MLGKSSLQPFLLDLYVEIAGGLLWSNKIVVTLDEYWFHFGSPKSSGFELLGTLPENLSEGLPKRKCHFLTIHFQGRNYFHSPRKNSAEFWNSGFANTTPPPSKTIMAMENAPFQDVFLNHWKWGFSNLILVFRCVIFKNYPLPGRFSIINSSSSKQQPACNQPPTWRAMPKTCK